MKSESRGSANGCSPVVEPRRKRKRSLRAQAQRAEVLAAKHQDARAFEELRRARHAHEDAQARELARRLGWSEDQLARWAREHQRRAGPTPEQGLGRGTVR